MSKLIDFFLHPFGKPTRFPFCKPEEDYHYSDVVFHEPTPVFIPEPVQEDLSVGVYVVRQANSKHENAILASRARGRIERLNRQIENYKKKGLNIDKLQLSVDAYQRQLKWSEPEI